MEYQTFFIGNTHYSETHRLHNDPLVSTQWNLAIPSDRPSGYQQYGPTLGHDPYYGQTTLNMFSPGGSMILPSMMNNY